MNNIKKEQENPELEFEDNEIYADANFFIFAFANIDEEGEKARKILEYTREGKIKLYTSTLTIDEVMWIIQHEKNREKAGEIAKAIILTSNIELINVTYGIIDESINNYKKESLNPRDAIHLSSMQSKKIKTILSTDSDFDKIKGIKRLDFTK